MDAKPPRPIRPDSTPVVREDPLTATRRYFLRECGVGIGKVALAGLLCYGTGKPVAAGPQPADPLAPKAPHFRARARHVIHLFMAGAPSQLELFDYKPLLSRLEGKPLPESVIGDQRYAFIPRSAGVLGPRFRFRKCGESGIELSEALVHLPRVADRLCLVRSVHTDQFNHAPAQLFMNTGFAQPGRPSMGSWIVYGLGSECDDLPAFVVMTSGGGLSGGAALWSSGFLPTVYSGVRFRNGSEPILNTAPPPGVSPEMQRDTYDLLERLNRKRLGVLGDPEISTRIAAAEMAARMQLSAPELVDLRQETRETLDLYGCDPDKPSFARSCLLARRLVERGVRMINLYHKGWDAHSDVQGNIRTHCGITDRAVTALLIDLERRGLLQETLVIWGGEFGRTPMVETNPALGRKLGRDHHPQAFTVWMAGGGIRPGMVYGKTDEFGFHVVENPVHIHDLQATILYCLGLDHERLTYHHAGRDFRLTDVHGRVIREVLA